MLATIVALSLAVSPAFAVEEKELSEDAKKELKKLEGKWTATKVIAEGKEETPPEDRNTVEFKERKFLFGDKELFDVAALDPSTNPKCLDFKAVIDMGEIQKGTVYEAIYKVDGDTLTLAIYVGGSGNRPSKFESAEGSKTVVVTFERQKK